ERTFGGPEIDQNLGMVSKRRSLYFRHAPEKMMEFLTMFDSANVNECYMRSESVVPQQALAMANSQLVLVNARLLARKLADKVGAAPAPNNARAFVALAFAHTLGRPASSEEEAACVRFLNAQVTLLQAQKNLTQFPGGTSLPVPPAADPHLRARENLVHVLFNHNEFVTIR